MPPKGRIEVDDQICKACELCITYCPKGVIALAPDRINARGYHPAELAIDECTGCGICSMVCPEAAITIYRQTAPQQRTTLQEV